jgi:hypothetical protein
MQSLASSTSVINCDWSTGQLDPATTWVAPAGLMWSAGGWLIGKRVLRLVRGTPAMGYTVRHAVGIYP